MTTRRTLRTAALVCAAAVVGVACGDEDGGDAAPAEPVATAAATEPAVDGGADASSGAVPASLQFTAPLIGGGEIVGDELAGKPTAFWFWSPT